MRWKIKKKMILNKFKIIKNYLYNICKMKMHLKKFYKMINWLIQKDKIQFNKDKILKFFLTTRKIILVSQTYKKLSNLHKSIKL